MIYAIIYFLDIILWTIQKIYNKLYGKSAWIYFSLFDDVKWIKNKGYKFK